MQATLSVTQWLESFKSHNIPRLLVSPVGKRSTRYFFKLRLHTYRKIDCQKSTSYLSIDASMSEAPPCGPSTTKPCLQVEKGKKGQCYSSEPWGGGGEKGPRGLISSNARQPIVAPRSTDPSPPYMKTDVVLVNRERQQRDRWPSRLSLTVEFL
jgi:hypothetical protein